MALAFNGSSDRFVATTAVATLPVTFAAWVRSSVANAGVVCAVNDYSAQFMYHLGQITNGIVQALANSGGTSGAANATQSFTTNAWHHVAYVFESTSLRHAYLNGGNKGSNTTSISTSGLDTTTIGGIYRATSPLSFNGQIAEAAIWSAVLTDAEIAQLAVGLSPLLIGQRRSSLVVYQDMIRPINRPGTGPPFTATGSPAAAAHPRIIYPTSQLRLTQRPHRFVSPYRGDTAIADGSRLLAGAASLAGAELGTTVPFGEVVT